MLLRIRGVSPIFRGGDTWKYCIFFCSYFCSLVTTIFLHFFIYKNRQNKNVQNILAKVLRPAYGLKKDYLLFVVWYCFLLSVWNTLLSYLFFIWQPQTFLVGIFSDFSVYATLMKRKDIRNIFWYLDSIVCLEYASLLFWVFLVRVFPHSDWIHKNSEYGHFSSIESLISTHFRPMLPYFPHEKIKNKKSFYVLREDK